MLKIFSYGILRKRSFIQHLRENYNIKRIECIPDSIKGYVPYHSNGVNFIVPVTDKVKAKNKDADFVVKGTLLSIDAEQSVLDEIEVLIDNIESGYEKILENTENGVEAVIVYIASPSILQRLDVYGRELVLYPDSILYSVKYEGKEVKAVTVYQGHGDSHYTSRDRDDWEYGFY